MPFLALSTYTLGERLALFSMHKILPWFQKIESKKNNDTIEWDFHWDSPTPPILSSLSTSGNVREELKWITDQVTQLTNSIANWLKESECAWKARIG